MGIFVTLHRPGYQVREGNVIELRDTIKVRALAVTWLEPKEGARTMIHMAGGGSVLVAENAAEVEAAIEHAGETFELTEVGEADLAALSL